MTPDAYNASLFSFLDRSPTAFHAAENIAATLLDNDWVRLREDQRWKLPPSGRFFVLREGGALIAFSLGRDESPEDGFRILGAHLDSPALQLKPQPSTRRGSLTTLGVEGYGGLLYNPWFDRELSLAGRVCLETADGQLRLVLIDWRRPLLVIPSLAIHFDREANTGRTVNLQHHMRPLLGQPSGESQAAFAGLLEKQIECEHPHLTVRQILGFDLFCYDPKPCLTVGIDNEFISAPRLDNLLSCHAAMTALIAADTTKNCLLYCTNHEENGSMSSTGAQSNFLDAVLDRLAPDTATKIIVQHRSMFTSMDNAHATHPNFSDQSDAEHEIHLNRGPVIKINANQRYASNSATVAMFTKVCRDSGLEPQLFVMRSDLPCGSTIGPITAAKQGIRTLDIGCATLAMHSIRELTGADDPRMLFAAASALLSSDHHKQLT